MPVFVEDISDEAARDDETVLFGLGVLGSRVVNREIDPLADLGVRDRFLAVDDGGCIEIEVLDRVPDLLLEPTLRIEAAILTRSDIS